MGDNSSIEWTDATWSPTVGCSWTSDGCTNCYAARQAAGRLSSTPVYAGLAIGHGPHGAAEFTGEIRCLPERLDLPLRWKRPRRIFVDSMSDLFHLSVPTEFIGSVFAVMAEAAQHQFQVLTKRPQRMASLDLYRLALQHVTEANAKNRLGANWQIRPFQNVWLGTSIESDRYSFRADHLRDTNAAIRFLSLEPLLGPLPSLDLTDIDWVIVGGESGPGARPMHPDWARDIRDRCITAGIPFFFKQWGEWGPKRRDLLERRGNLVHVLPDGTEYDGRTNESWQAGTTLFRNGKKTSGRTLDGRTWDQLPAGAP